ncbi:MAG: CsgG/HfaB family protein [Pelosinus sp.]|nr:CsgG/HfaB family protein [Pelosinus sp.]
MRRLLTVLVFLIIFCQASITLCAEPGKIKNDEFAKLAQQIISSLPQQAIKHRIAVFDFRHFRKGITTKVGCYLSGELTDRLLATKKLDVVERQQLNKLLDEQALGATGAITEETAAKLGNLLGADIICLGTHYGGNRFMHVDVRVVSSETGAVLYSGSAKHEIDETLRDIMN